MMYCFPVFAQTAENGIVPPWITGSTNSLVNNMRSLAGKVSSSYFGIDGATTCCYSVSVSLRGVPSEYPYGADKEKYGMDTSTPHPGDITDVDILIDVADKNGDWHPVDSGYTPKPGDCAVTIGIWRDALNPDPNGYYQTGHVVMVTENGGCIYNGGQSGGIIEYDIPAEAVYRGMAARAGSGYKPVAGYIETSKYSDGAGVLNNKVDWGLDMMATIADGLNDIINQFTILANTVMGVMIAGGAATILSLIIIDFASYLIFNMQDGFRLSGIIGKLLKYTFFLWLFLNWDTIVNTIFLDFAQSTATAVAGGNTSGNLTQPQFLLIKGVEAISPALNFISNAKGLTNISNWPLLALLLLLSFITLFALIFSAIYVAFIFIEFYITAAFSAVFMMFPVLRFTKFIGELGINGLIKSTIRLFAAGVLVFLVAKLIGDANFLLDFPADINALADGTLRKFVVLCIHIWIFVYLIVTFPTKISRIYTGGVKLPD